MNWYENLKKMVIAGRYPNKEAMIHTVGLMVLMGFMLFVTYKDILKLF